MAAQPARPTGPTASGPRPSRRTATTTDFAYDTAGTPATTAFNGANRPTSGANPSEAFSSDDDGRLTARPGQQLVELTRFGGTQQLGRSRPEPGVHMPNPKPPQPPEFRAEAVRLARQPGHSIRQVAHDLRIANELLRRWILSD